jgi:hypothetical protein
VKSRLPRKPQPVPPIFQPELGAEVLYYAAHARRREIYFGWPTIKAIVGNKVAAWYVDRYLAENGYESQQHDGAVDPDRPHNLWEPLPGDFGAHGEFDERATTWSPQLWLNMRRDWLMAGATALALFVATAALARRR